ncbi:hypothetical protein ACSAZL_21575 [Methanosarcina sp. T3]|uniref:hypothetical protein n=1 Tax=Methanosarcina sp. T3 TaxID=3439062 RepID=UPI003F8241CF
MSSTNCFLSPKFDDIIPILGIASSTLLIFVCLPFNRTMYLFPGILSLIACMIWFGMRKKAFYNQYARLSFSTGIILNSLYFIFFSLSILSIYFRPDLYERPLLYFILMSLIVGVMALRIFCNNISNSLFIFQTILIGISISWSQLLIFPSVLGVDPWYHQFLTLIILNTHFIPDGYNYSQLPLFHILITLTSLITGLDYKFATMFSVSLSQIICNVLFIFLLGKFLFNDRIGLLASLLLIVANYHIYMSYWSIPNSFGVIFVLFLLYLLSKVKMYDPILISIISILLMVDIILTHTIVSIFTAIILTFYWFGNSVCNILYSKKYSPITVNYSILFTVSMFAWWSFASGHLGIFSNFLKWGFSMDIFATAPMELISENIVTVPFSERLFNQASIFLFFALSFVGCFYMMSKRYGNHNTFNFAFIGLTPLFLGFFSLISGHTIVESRWWYFAQLLLSIPLALSLTLITSYVKQKYLSSGLFFFLVVFMSFFLIMNPFANTDNHMFSPNSSITHALTASELQAAKTTSIIWEGTIKTDEYYAGTQQYYASTQQYKYNFENFSYEISQKDPNKLQNKLVLIRKEVIGKLFKLFSYIVRLDYDPRILLDEHGFSQIYDCGSVGGYLKV